MLSPNFFNRPGIATAHKSAPMIIVKSTSKLLAFILLAAPAPGRSFQVNTHLIPTHTGTHIRVSPATTPRAPYGRITKHSSSNTFLWAINNDGADKGSQMSDEVRNRQSLNNSIGHFLQQLSKFRPLILSLAVFLLSFSLALPSFAVQSGGRIGGSVGGGNRSSGGYSRSYGGGGGYSKGFSRGYSSGYYSRPNVVISPGITPYYR